MSSFASYIIGFLILIVGLAFGAYLLTIPSMWIGATSRTKMRDPAAGTSASNTTAAEPRTPTAPTK